MGTGVLTIWRASRSSLRVPNKRLDARIPRWVVPNIRLRSALRVRSFMRMAFCMPRVLANAHGAEQSLADPAISWQAVSKLVLANRSPRCSSVHAIDRTMIEAFTSQA